MTAPGRARVVLDVFLWALGMVLLAILAVLMADAMRGGSGLQEGLYWSIW
jgi:hypothetical protein